ncbi:hypothetical protein KKA00_08490, partial [bacterium]|nr:hypothetical protein [bacterium]
MKTIIWLLCFSALAVSAAAQTYINGDLSGTLGPGEYIVVGDCYVQLSESLTIEPGTTLFFSDYFTLYVYGQLLAEGTVQDSIRFTRYYPTEDCYHGGIRFMPGDSVQNRISYCHIEYANNED